VSDDSLRYERERKLMAGEKADLRAQLLAERTAHAETKRSLGEMLERIRKRYRELRAFQMPMGLYLGACGHYWDSTENGIGQCPICRRLSDATNEAIRECAEVVDEACGFSDAKLALMEKYPDAFTSRIATPESAAPVERCAERHDKLPYSSDHLWNVEIHGLPQGPCTKCGEDYQEYAARAWKDIQPLLAPVERKDLEAGK
jgi:hypothetical protein